MIAPDDVVLALSNSGESAEIVTIVPLIKRRGAKLISMTGNPASTLAREADVHLNAAVDKEACPLNLAPTASTTTMLVLCDALAMVLLETRGFQPEDFARLHPGGSLGRALLTRVADVMRQGDQLALIHPWATIQDALQAMTRARSGAAVVVTDEGGLAGVFTHGDFVRAFQKQPDIALRPVADFMTVQPVTLQADRLAAEVLSTLRTNRVDDIVVIDIDGRPVGLVDTQDLTRLRLV
jgi:arabinose-5-phosphate isomerase